MRRASLILPLILLITGICQAAFAQENILINTLIQAEPSTAVITVDGILTKSGETIPLRAGIHEFKFDAPNYPSRTVKYLIYGAHPNVYVDLRTKQDELFSKTTVASMLAGITGYYAWNTKDELFFTSFEGTSNPSFDYIFDARNQTLKSVSRNSFLDMLENETSIRKKFNLPNRFVSNNVLSYLYPSPSGKYLLYGKSDGDTHVHLAIYNTQTKQEKVFSGVNLWNGFNPLWTANEQAFYLHGYLGYWSIFFVLKDNEFQFIQIGEFKTRDGKNVSTYGDSVLTTRPSENGFVLLRGWEISEDTHSPRALYLIDYRTMIGTHLLNLEDYDTYSEIFSPDGKWVYFKDKDGLKRISTADPSRGELVSDEFSEKNGVYGLTFSYTLDYALIWKSTVSTKYQIVEMNLPK